MVEKMRWVLVLVLAACEHGQSPTDAVNPGGDGRDDGGPSGVCAINGSAQITGTVGGVQINPVMRAHQFLLGGEGTVIVFDEDVAACGQPGQTGEHLIVAFCDPPAVGTFVIGAGDSFSCPGSTQAALIESTANGDLALSTGGTITITQTDGACTSGTFSIDLVPNAGGATGTLTGSFDAVVCTP